MSVYADFASCYDRLTDDVPYEKWADYIERLFKKYRVKPELLLDLACGTGSLTKLFCLRGYDVIGVDASPEMLNAAREKCAELENPPLLLSQTMQKLDLYGTVGAVVCSLDSVNYLTDPRALNAAFSRVGLFLEPGGLFVFDVNTEKKLRGLDGSAFVREAEGVYCVWQSVWDGRGRRCKFYIDLFFGDGRRYERKSEVHTERAYGIDELFSALSDNGMEPLGAFGELSLRPASPDDDRIFIAARKR